MPGTEESRPCRVCVSFHDGRKNLNIGLYVLVSGTHVRRWNPGILRKPSMPTKSQNSCLGNIPFFMTIYHFLIQVQLSHIFTTYFLLFVSFSHIYCLYL